MVGPLLSLRTERQAVNKMTLSVAAIFLQIFLLGSGPPAAAASREGENFYRKGVQAYRRENFSGAAQAFRHTGSRGQEAA